MASGSLLDRCRVAAAKDDVPADGFDERSPYACPRGSGTELRMGSSGMSGSPGKYICVTSLLARAGPNSEKWTCAGRQALSWLRHGYAPGLTVMKRYSPPSSVRHLPAPVKLGSSGAGWSSTGSRYRPAAFACQISTSVLRTGRPSESVTRPLTTIRSPSGWPACCRVRSASSGWTAMRPNAGPGARWNHSSGSLTGACFGARSSVAR